MWSLVVAQAEQSGAVGRIVVSVGLMVGALIVLAVILAALRRRLLAPAREPTAGMFEHLRKMRDEGTISPEEYDAIRRQMVSKAAGRPAADETASATPTMPPRTDSRSSQATPGADSSRTGQPPID